MFRLTRHFRHRRPRRVHGRQKSNVFGGSVRLVAKADRRGGPFGTRTAGNERGTGQCTRGCGSGERPGHALASATAATRAAASVWSGWSISRCRLVAVTHTRQQGDATTGITICHAIGLARSQARFAFRNILVALQPSHLGCHRV